MLTWQRLLPRQFALLPQSCRDGGTRHPEQQLLTESS